MCLGTNMNPLE